MYDIYESIDKPPKPCIDVMFIPYSHRWDFMHHSCAQSHTLSYAEQNKIWILVVFFRGGNSAKLVEFGFDFSLNLRPCLKVPEGSSVELDITI